jgi:aldehyde:ferredoxin oxidoreductase
MDRRTLFKLTSVAFAGALPQAAEAAAPASAAGLWGLDVPETEEKLYALHGKDSAIASIGPVGEAVSMLACIMNDRDRAAGRSGLGAVMGSKKLKAVVARGKQAIPLADEAKMNADRKARIEQMQATGLYALFHNFGTSGLTAGAVASGDCPIKNWAGSSEDFKTAAKISDEAVQDIQYRKYGCWHCPIACGGHTIVKGGPYASDGHNLLSNRHDRRSEKSNDPNAGFGNAMFVDGHADTIERKNSLDPYYYDPSL